MIENDCRKFAKNVTKYRELKGYNKSRLCELVDCDLSYIGKIERAEKFPNLKMIPKLAEPLEFPAIDLFHLEQQRK